MHYLSGGFSSFWGQFLVPPTGSSWSWPTSHLWSPVNRCALDRPMEPCGSVHLAMAYLQALVHYLSGGISSFWGKFFVHRAPPPRVPRRGVEGGPNRVTPVKAQCTGTMALRLSPQAPSRWQARGTVQTPRGPRLGLSE